MATELQRWVCGPPPMPAERPAAASLHGPASDGLRRLPAWAGGTVGFPTAFACSSLFSAMARDEPVERLKSLRIAATAGTQIRYTGHRLSQRDADVFLHLLARANAVPLGEAVRFTAHCLLLDLGWDTNSRGYVRLRDSVLKLNASAIECEWTAGTGRRLRYAGSLIGAFRWRDEVNGRTLREWTIRLEPKLGRLFHESTCSLVNLRARRGLRNHELAKWLHACLSTQRDGVCVMRAATIRDLCGSTAKTLFGFRRTLRQALDVLVGHQLVQGYAIDPSRDLVCFGPGLPAHSGARTLKAAPPAPVASHCAGLTACATRPLERHTLPR